MTPDRLIVVLTELLDRLQVRYAIVGSVASISYGEPRLTNDVDVVAELSVEHIGAFLAAFPGPEFYLSEAAMRSAIQKRFQFNILDVAEGFKADVYQSADDEIHRLLLERRVWLETGVSAFAWVASPEDVILGKLQYHRLGGSPKHIRDIARMLQITDQTFDQRYLDHWIGRLRLQDSWMAVEESIKSDESGPNADPH